MAWLDEKLTEQFYRWELRGRGWQVFDAPVSVEPPFVPFHGHNISAPQQEDDGRKETFLSSFIQKLSGVKKSVPALPSFVSEDQETTPVWLEREDLEEITISLRPNVSIPREAFETFLSSLSILQEPIAFELIGTHQTITPQFVVNPADTSLIRRLSAAYFPEAVLTPIPPPERSLESIWNDPTETAIVEFGLTDEFMLPLAAGKTELLIGLTAALADLQTDEVGLFQVLFQPVHSPWAENAVRAVTDQNGGAFFVNRHELISGTKQKLSRPLFAAVVRLAAKSDDYRRAWQIVREMAGALRGLTNPNGNHLMPLRNDDYPLPYHEEDVLLRQSRRPGMILNSDELLSLVHLPSTAVKSSKLVQERNRTKPAPKIVSNHGGLFFGHNHHAGKVTEVQLNAEQRVRHTHVIGASGTGKSTLLLNLIRQDIENGEGVAVLDPHGDLIEQILNVIPPHRINDVVLLDPSDESFPVGFNILSAHSDLEKTLLASDLVSVFQRLSTSWGDQMSSVLHNAILAFLESSEGGTLSDLRRFLLDAKYRNEFLKTVRDPEVVYYWQKGFPQLSGNKSLGPVLTRLETFLSPKPIRYIVSQSDNRLDFADIVDSGKIFLAKLPQGLIGRENAYLLGSLLISKFQQTAMSRQQQEAKGRRDFWIYADEFHHFITPSMAEILSGARKYRVGLILAHQELRQLQRDSEVASAVLSNCFTRVVFRVGDADARALSEGFSTFEARDLQNLEIGEAICRVERSDFDFNLSVPFSEPIDSSSEIRDQVIAASRAKYARPRSEVEVELFQRLQPSPAEPPQKTATAVPKTKPVVSESPKNEEPIQAPEKETVSENKTFETKIEREAPTLGRGGATHKDLQMLIKTAAESLGFRATLESSTPNGKGSVDVVLEKADLRIACEISVTTRVEHEVGNIRKCVNAEFTHIALISSEAKRLEQIADVVKLRLSESERERIGYFSLDDFLAHLRTLSDIAEPIPQTSEPLPNIPKVKTKGGWKIKTKVSEMTAEEAKTIEDQALKAIAETLRKKT